MGPWHAAQLGVREPFKVVLCDAERACGALAIRRDHPGEECHSGGKGDGSEQHGSISVPPWNRLLLEIQRRFRGTRRNDVLLNEFALAVVYLDQPVEIARRMNYSEAVWKGNSRQRRRYINTSIIWHVYGAAKAIKKHCGDDEDKAGKSDRQFL